MLVISRRANENLVFPGFNAVIRVLELNRATVRLGIEAPRDVTVLRGELAARDVDGGKAAAPAPDPTLDRKLAALNVLLGVARLQLDAGIGQAAEDTLDQARRDLEALRPPRDAAPPMPVLEPGKRRRTALLVEDNANERELLARLLRLAGIDVDTAGDGADALDYLRRREAPDVVLLDMGLPRCDGPTAVREIRRDPRTAGLKVFAVSGHLPSEYHWEGPSQRIDAWFSKPIDPEALLERLGTELPATAASGR